MEKLLLSPEEAAEALGVGRSRVYDLMRTRQLHSVRIGKSRRVQFPQFTPMSNV
jgi:excisionase family DNA binding protein